VIASPSIVPDTTPQKTDVSQTTVSTAVSPAPASSTTTAVETSVVVDLVTPTSLVPAAAPGSQLVPFTFILKADGKAYARGTLPDEAVVQSVLASGEAVVGTGNVVLDNVTTDPAATFELSRKNLLTTSFYYTQGNGDISLDHQLRLDIVATMMIDNPNLIAYISGYSDSTGSTAGNLKLSQIRVDKLSEYLTSKGVPADQFRLAVIGEEQPVGDNATESGRALNRRVDIQFDGLGQGL
jgi:outer membrane protein OmpA-like peptidoglycan-associated protein